MWKIISDCKIWHLIAVLLKMKDVWHVKPCRLLSRYRTSNDSRRLKSLIYDWLISLKYGHTRHVQIFQKCWTHLNILDPRMVTWIKIHTEEPKIWGAITHTLFTNAIWNLRFVHPFVAVPRTMSKEVYSSFKGTVTDIIFIILSCLKHKLAVSYTTQFFVHILCARFT
jgi:hypothetical protein